MISAKYDFKEFVDAIIDKDYHEILAMAEKECTATEGRSYGVKGAVKARELGSTKYAARLKKLLFFMRYGIVPYGINDYDYYLLKPLCEALIRKGQFKSEVMKLFDVHERD